MSTTVRRMLEAKSDVYSTTPDTTVLDALREMADRNVGALVVLEGGKLSGIFSERDYARKVVLAGRSSKDTRVGEIMTRDVVCVAPAQTASDCMTLMTDRRIRHLPVTEDGRLVGVVSIGDVVRAVISEQQATIEDLVGYIGSGS